MKRNKIRPFLYFTDSTLKKLGDKAELKKTSIANIICTTLEELMASENNSQNNPKKDRT